ncbi:MAG: PIG-L family deacetylase [Bacillota bacterium]|nr:PIG-L family deacetylase [Bacillota bacterium]
MGRWWLLLVALAVCAPLILLAPLPSSRNRQATAAPRTLEVRRLGRRILVLAPHPDDEVLGAGGLVETALRAGDQVWVAVATSGESSTPAAIRALHVARPTPADFARLGALRRNESREGTRTLGLPSSHLIFLGYADGSLTPIWMGAWDCRHPRVSGRTHVAYSLLANGFDPHVAYCGPDLVGDLERLLLEVRPDTVVLPDPADHHPDHSGLADFAWAAVMAYDRARPAGAPEPQLYGYLVHYPGWPQQWGEHPTLQEAFPSPWTGGPVSWLRLPLTAAATSVKGRALLEYRSQLAVSRAFLEAFVRRDELFTRRPLVLPLGPHWLDLGQVRPLGTMFRLMGGRPLPRVVRLSRYAGPPTTLSARSPEPGRIELRLTGEGWPRRRLALRLYAWQVRPGGPDRRLEFDWQDGRARLVCDGSASGQRPDWRLSGRELTWSFDGGGAPWQVAATIVENERPVGTTPWLAVSAASARPGTLLQVHAFAGTRGPLPRPSGSAGRTAGRMGGGAPSPRFLPAYLKPE